MVKIRSAAWWIVAATCLVSVGCAEMPFVPDVRDVRTEVGSDGADVPMSMDVAPEAGCPMGMTQCGSQCVNTQTDNGNCGSCRAVCPAGIGCVTGSCSCPMGRLVCNNMCIDPQMDAMNCGMCGNACPMGQVCSFGMCMPECTAPRMFCRDAMGMVTCSDTTSDPMNCGSCGARCGAGYTCAMGRCVCQAPNMQCGTACANVMTDRDNCGMCGVSCGMTGTCAAGRCMCGTGGTLCGTSCVDTQTDNFNCGACGTICFMGQTCMAGRCVCAGGMTGCGAACVDLMTSTSHCGMCGRACPPTAICMGGMCQCPAGQTACGTTCVNLMTDRTNCGGCGTVCATGATCVAGMCQCPTGQTACGGRCTDTQTDVANCGMCGTSCGPGGVCTTGRCMCAAGLTMCGAACADTRFDNMNCGMCGNACPSGMACVMGSCTAAPPTRYMQLPTTTGATLVDACAAPGRVTLLPSTDDNAAPATLPFPVRYWATNLAMGASINICSNGWIGMDGMLNASLGGTVPSAAAPNAVIAPHWRDLVTSATGVCVATVGTAPNRRWVVEWPNMRYFGGSGSFTFETVITEGTNTIDFIYGTVTGITAGTSGIENQTGAMGINSCPGGTGTCTPAANTMIRFVPIP